MNKLTLLAASAIALALPTVAHGQATSLPVNGVVTGYCAASLGNVSSGTLSLAEVSPQRIAKIKLNCNSIGSKLKSSVKHGDFRGPVDASSNTGFQIINYDWSLVVPAPDASLGWPLEDRIGPGPSSKTTTRSGYSFTLANGVDAEFFLDVCYNGSIATQQCNGSDSAAITAPAGTYVEEFSFELTA